MPDDAFLSHVAGLPVGTYAMFSDLVGSATKVGDDRWFIEWGDPAVGGSAIGTDADLVEHYAPALGTFLVTEPSAIIAKSIEAAVARAWEPTPRTEIRRA